METVSQFVRARARVEPVLYDRMDPESVRLYVERQGGACFDWGKAGESKRRLPKALAVLGRLLRPLSPTGAATLPRDHILSRGLAEQGEVDTESEGQPTIAVKAPADIPSDSVQHPADPDRSDNTHRGQGYMTPIMATYAEDDEAAGAMPGADPIPELITPVAGHPMTPHELQALEPAVAEVKARQVAPHLLLGDGVPTGKSARVISRLGLTLNAGGSIPTRGSPSASDAWPSRRLPAKIVIAGGLVWKRLCPASSIRWALPTCACEAWRPSRIRCFGGPGV